jgi:hypothetical protein
MGNANLHATMAPEDKEALVDYCAEQGVSSTGFITGFVLCIDDIPADVMEMIIKAGRKVDGQRRRRGPKPSKKVAPPPEYGTGVFGPQFNDSEEVDDEGGE